jgi:hypothetical protein
VSWRTVVLLKAIFSAWRFFMIIPLVFDPAFIYKYPHLLRVDTILGSMRGAFYRSSASTVKVMQHN